MFITGKLKDQSVKMLTALFSSYYEYPRSRHRIITEQHTTINQPEQSGLAISKQHTTLTNQRRGAGN